AGWAALPVLRGAAGQRIGILAYSLRPQQYDSGPPAFAIGSESEVLRDVERLRCDANYVIVSLHWGEEFAADPSVAEVRFARQIIEAGAALLIGHHPHVVRPIVL